MYEPPPTTTKEDDSYMPHSDQGKRWWMFKFLRAIERSETRFGIPGEEFEQCKMAVDAFIALADKVCDRPTRTTALTYAKNSARKEAVGLCRALAMRLKHGGGLSSIEMQMLGLHVDDRSSAPRQPPERCPVLKVSATEYGGHEIRFAQRDAASGVTAKPKSVTHLLLFAAIGDQELPVSEARLIAGVTKQPHKVNFPANRNMDGKMITYYGRWINRKGEMGPWSRGVSMILSRASATMEHIEFKHLFDETGINNQTAQAA